MLLLANTNRLLSTSPPEAPAPSRCCARAPSIRSSCTGKNSLSSQHVDQLSSPILHELKGLCSTLAGTSTGPAQPGNHRHLVNFLICLDIYRRA